MTQLKSTSDTAINTTSYLPVLHWQLMENNSNARTCKLSRAESSCIEIRKWCPPKQEKQVQICLCVCVYDQYFSSGIKTKLSEKKNKQTTTTTTTTKTIWELR